MLSDFSCLFVLVFLSWFNKVELNKPYKPFIKPAVDIQKGKPTMSFRSPEKNSGSLDKNVSKNFQSFKKMFNDL